MSDFYVVCAGSAILARRDKTRTKMTKEQKVNSRERKTSASRPIEVIKTTTAETMTDRGSP